MSAFIGEGATTPGDERPLTDQEYQLVQRLFGDPFSFPLQFKAWLISYLESSDLSLPMSAVLGLNSMLGITGTGSGSLGVFPAGLILPYGGDTAPAGSLLCDGGSYPRSTYSRLWTAIGGRYGMPDANTFNVPDLRGRVPVGVGPVGDHDALGKSDSLAAGQRGIKHRHSVSDPGHAHTLSPGPGVDDGGSVRWSETTGGTPAATSSVGTGLGVGTGTPLDAPAFLTINFIIVA